MLKNEMETTVRRAVSTVRAMNAQEVMGLIRHECPIAHSQASIVLGTVWVWLDRLAPEAEQLQDLGFVWGEEGAGPQAWVHPCAWTGRQSMLIPETESRPGIRWFASENFDAENIPF